MFTGKYADTQDCPYCKSHRRDGVKCTFFSYEKKMRKIYALTTRTSTAYEDWVIDGNPAQRQASCIKDYRDGRVWKETVYPAIKESKYNRPLALFVDAVELKKRGRITSQESKSAVTVCLWDLGLPLSVRHKRQYVHIYCIYPKTKPLLKGRYIPLKTVICILVPDKLCMSPGGITLFSNYLCYSNYSTVGILDGRCTIHG